MSKEQGIMTASLVEQPVFLNCVVTPVTPLIISFFLRRLLHIVIWRSPVKDSFSGNPPASALYTLPLMTGPSTPNPEVSEAPSTGGL